MSRTRALGLVAAAIAVLSCRGEDVGSDVRPRVREVGELALPPSASAPRVMRDAEAPDTLDPDSIEHFEVVDLDSLRFVGPGPDGLGGDQTVDAISEAYRRHYAEALESGGSAVEGRIDRDLQHEAERRTARDRGFGDWTEMIGVLSAEERARLVDRLNEANVELARDLHGPVETQEPTGATPPS